MAALQQELEEARQAKSDADLALKAAQNKVENARQAKRDADAASQQADENYRQGRVLDPREAGFAGMRAALAGQAIPQAERALPPTQTAAAHAAARVQALERRQQIFVKIGAQCLDPHTAEETRQCKRDYLEANFGTEQDFATDLGPIVSGRYNDLLAAEQRAREQKAQAEQRAHEQEAQELQGAAQSVQRAREQEAQQAYRAEVAKNVEDAKQRGFTPVSFDDFLLDGKKLAESGAKVSVAGIYQKNGDFAALFVNTMAAIQNDTNTSIPVLTGNATRDARSFFLKCDQDTLRRGCNIISRFSGRRLCARKQLSWVRRTFLASMSRMLGTSRPPTVKTVLALAARPPRFRVSNPSPSTRDWRDLIREKPGTVHLESALSALEADADAALPE